MNRRQAAFALGGVVLAGDAMAAGPTGEVRIATEEGWRVIAGEEAKSYQAANAWLEARLKDVEKVKVGTTYAELAKLFRRDGGLSKVTQHRFVLILCPYLKIDVEFEDNKGVKIGYPVPATAKAVSVSKAYFEREFAD